MPSYEWIAREQSSRNKQQPLTVPALHHPLKSFGFLATTGFVNSESIDLFGKREKTTNNSSKSGSVTSLTTKTEDALSTTGAKSSNKPKFIDPLGVTFENTTINGTVDNDLLQNGAIDSKKIDLKSEKIKNTLLLEDYVDSIQLEFDPKLENFETWSTKKRAVLNKFTTNEKLSIVTSFLPGGVPLHTQVAVSDVKLRLEQLDLFQSNSVRRIQNLSQKEYVEKISELTKALVKAWSDDQRVQAIKIVIQCAKFLSDTVTVPRFYPSQFFLVVDVLDTFGRLVFDRLKQKVTEEANEHPHNLRHVPEATKEIARNWFYKIASIRELLPRFYVEAALAGINRFIDTLEHAIYFTRLAEACRGIGDPIASIYARCYLTKVALNVDPTLKDHVWRCFHDTLLLLDRNFAGVDGGRDIRDLLEPALIWILQCLCYGIAEQDVNAIVECCRQRRSLLLNFCVLRAMPAKFISGNASDWLRIIKTSAMTDSAPYSDDCHWLSRCLQRMGAALSLVEPPSPDDSLRLLKEAWKIFRRFDPCDYAPCSVAWLQFACQHFGSREINALIDDVTKTLTPDRRYESYYAELSDMLNSILRSMVPKYGFSIVFSIEKFSTFIDMFQRNDIKVEAAKNVLTCFCKFTQPFECDDSAMSNYAIAYCRVLHDNLNALNSSEDEKRYVGALICKTLDRFTFGDDFERQLMFYVDARTYFFELDAVTVRLVHLVNCLIMQIRARITANRRSTRKMGDFVRSCVAFVFVTIPAIADRFVKLRLYILSISVALAQNCHAQVDGLIRAAIDVLRDLPPQTKISENRSVSNEQEIVACMQHFLSVLLIVPDSPNDEPLSYFTDFLSVVCGHPWSENCDSLFIVLLKCLTYLSWASQLEYPYHVDGGIESNDVLYGGHDSFLTHCRQKGGQVVDLLLNRLKVLGQNQKFRRQSVLCLDFVDILIRYASLEASEQLLALTVNLWTLARKYGQMDENHCLAIVRYVENRLASTEQFSSSDNKEAWSRLLRLMHR